ncbi:hypothetical protein TNCV_2837021 [Trichonephila clavipes]|nr:hypothetical protein TNCV_2837021 [Trichonephila clavipes]
MCQINNYKNALPAGRLIPIVSNYPNELVTLDLLGPYPVSRSGFDRVQRRSNKSQDGKKKGSEVKCELEKEGLSFRNDQGEKHTNKTNKRRPLIRSIPSSWSEKALFSATSVVQISHLVTLTAYDSSEKGKDMTRSKRHVESDSLYQLAWSEYQDIQGTLQQAVSDFDSLSPCTNPGCSHQISPINSPKSTPPSPTRRNLQHKRKDEDNFEFPPLRKTVRKMVLESSEDIPVVNQFSLLPNVIIKQVSGQLAPPTTVNQNSTEVTVDQQKPGNNPLPPPIMMKITKTYREQVDTVKRIFPHPSD